ncbi:heparan sulfate 2-O-sulfotransferase 1-like [Solea senegalensis]|uniref:Heparan sulfate 2-O-sulfotransferase 1-like n=1 Tax=Solea senegalensis TaxID=28829 RepID=A0AAV6SAK7_SOLSE|nr:heparan sulfate 2-O-sulfotransferase 1-like [Solea senegalensis]
MKSFSEAAFLKQRTLKACEQTFDECVSSGGSDCAPRETLAADSILLRAPVRVLKSHLRKTTEKKPPTKETIAKLQQSDIWKLEKEFYEFALEQFQFVRAHAVREKDGELYGLGQNFFYEKIYPKVN